MKTIELELDVSIEASLAFTTTRDQLPKIITEPNPVTHLEQEIDQFDDKNLTRKDLWEVNVLSPLPDLISHRLPFNTVRIRSQSVWDHEELEVDWEAHLTQTDNFLNYCGGTITFQDDKDGSVIRLDGKFDVDVSDVPGIPKFLSDYLVRFQVPLVKRVISPYLPMLGESLKKRSR